MAIASVIIISIVYLFPTSAVAISINAPADMTLPAIPGTGGISTGTVTWTVSNAPSGYNFTIKTTGSPALNNGSESISDYHSATPEAWSVAAANSEFGFSAQGPSTPTATWGTPASGSGKYRGLNGATQINIAGHSSVLIGSESTTVYFKVEIGASHLQTSGMYTADIMATVTSLI